MLAPELVRRCSDQHETTLLCNQFCRSVAVQGPRPQVVFGEKAEGIFGLLSQMFDKPN